MPQFDLYANPDSDSKQAYPYFVDVQTSLLNDFDSRVVVPLIPLYLQDKQYPKNLCPIVVVDDNEYVLMTHQLATVSNHVLKEFVGTLRHYRSDIITALDFLLTGV